MDLEFDQEQLMLKDTVRSFIRREYHEENVRRMCIEKKGLAEFDAKLVDLGITGICFPEQYGGAELGMVSVAIVVEELARYGIDFGMTFGMNLAAGSVLLTYGGDTAKENYLARLISGQISTCLGYSEPFRFADPIPAKVQSSETDTLRIKTQTLFSENRDPGKGVMLLPVVQNGQAELLLAPLKAFKGAGDVKILGRELLGQVMYPAQCVACGPGHLFQHGSQAIEAISNWLKFYSILSCAGNMKTVVAKTVQYAQEREQFSQPIGKFQSIQHMIVDAKIGADSSLLYGYWLAWLLDENNGDALKLTKEINMANTFVTQAYTNAVNTGIQVMGGFGYMEESNMERYARDSRMAGFYLQDSVAQKINIAEGFDFQLF